MSLKDKTKGFVVGGLLAGAILSGGGFYANNSLGYSISQSQAQEIAYQHAGVSEAEVSYVQIKKDREGLTATYEIDFGTSSTDYDYTINAKTGSIMERDLEQNSTATQSNTTTSQQGQSKTSSSSTASSASLASGNWVISQDEAKSKALADAGLKETDITNLRIKTDIEDGLAVYEVDFDHLASNTEYDYTINAQDGSITEKSMDQIDD